MLLQTSSQKSETFHFLATAKCIRRFPTTSVAAHHANPDPLLALGTTAAMNDRSQQQRQWIHAIQNASFQPKPAAFSPLGSREENPLFEQQRQCRDKLDALAHVRQRVRFVPLANDSSNTGMQIHTRMILSQFESDTAVGAIHQSDLPASGIDALAGLEALLFAFLTHDELLCVSEVCRSWKETARHNVMWEPLLFSPVERYPLRSLLGAAKDLPAIQVYMVFKRLRLHELPKELQKRTALPIPELRVNPPLRPPHALHRARFFREERRRLLALLRGVQDNRVGEAPDGLPGPARPRPRRGAPLSSPAALSVGSSSVHLLGYRACDASTTAVPDALEALDPPDDELDLPEQLADLLAASRTRADREEALHFAQDGYQRTPLCTWLQERNRKLSEHVLRSFLRQLLLAVQALEQSGAAHADLSTSTIVVLEPVTAVSGDDDDDAPTTVERLKSDRTPLFQLDCSRHIVHVPTLRATQAPAGFGREDQQQQQQQRHAALLAVAMDDDDMGDDDVDLLELAEDALHRQPHRVPCMLNALFRCALNMWGAGRYPDSSAVSTTPLLSVLVLLHGHLPAGFRSFLEYGKFLTDSGLASASHLLHHAFVSAEPHGARTIPVRMLQTQDVLDYQASVLAWYGTAHARAATATTGGTGARQWTVRDPVQSLAAGALTDELVPATQMTAAYLQHALEEANLPRERFVSIQAPEIRSSSWIRQVAETQHRTLQRLDLSRVMLPTSVLLKELARLPRVTHLRLPGNIERPDDLEHFLAALSCTALLPNLYAMDANVQSAMDRMELVYREQLAMIEFLLARQ